MCFAHERKIGIAVGFLSSLGLNSCGNPASSEIHASLTIHPLLVEKQLLVFALKKPVPRYFNPAVNRQNILFSTASEDRVLFSDGYQLSQSPPPALSIFEKYVPDYLKLFIWKAVWLLLMKSILDELFLMFSH